MNLQIPSRVSPPSPIPPKISLLASSFFAVGWIFSGRIFVWFFFFKVHLVSVAHRVLLINGECRVLISGFIHYRQNTPESQKYSKEPLIENLASIYKAPPLMVKTSLRSEESKGDIKSGKWKRLDEEGNCRLVGVAKIDPIDDSLMNFFLALPTECLADLNAVISVSASS
ncbi:uncharacterized protein DS421_17g584450 [Arachis hypogaea]|nr:uncharacterized protein DS421_17g584450 [Arachis hypogaea]